MKAERWANRPPVVQAEMVVTRTSKKQKQTSSRNVSEEVYRLHDGQHVEVRERLF